MSELRNPTVWILGALLAFDLLSLQNQREV